MRSPTFRPWGHMFAVFLTSVLLPLALQAQGLESPHGDLPAVADCTACHTTEGWTPVKTQMDFDHNAQTAFTLLDSHGELSCATCHIGLRFDEPKVDQTNCVSCHFDVHLDAFSQDCATCHTTTTFQDVPTLEVHTRTSFPLTGAHLQVSCESCHTKEERGPFSSIDGTCMACHRDDYGRATVVDHDALGFPEDCTTCHNTLAWASTPAFNHAAMAGGFQLIVPHDALSCSSCHTQGGSGLQFNPQGDQECVACHRDDYNSAHIGDAFPTTCLTCHSSTTWSGARFNHGAFFPINNGAHKPETWNRDCTSCHKTPADFGNFTCLTCHEHRQSAMDEDHKEEPEYVYESSACYSCHTNGKS